MTVHEHHYFYEPPNGPISTGVCSCGATSTGANVSDLDLRPGMGSPDRKPGLGLRHWRMTNAEKVKAQDGRQM